MNNPFVCAPLLRLITDYIDYLSLYINLNINIYYDNFLIYQLPSLAKFSSQPTLNLAEAHTINQQNRLNLCRTRKQTV